MIQVRRVYDPKSRGPGARILVDRLWPRGLSKEKARVDLWMKDAAPSDKLRRWFAHDPGKWKEFKKLYQKIFKIEISDDEAYKQTADLLWLVKQTYKPMTKSQHKQYHRNLKKI